LILGILDTAARTGTKCAMSMLTVGDLRLIRPEARCVSTVEAMVRRLATMTEPPERFLERLAANRIPRVPGTAVFLTRIAEAIPPLMILHGRKSVSCRKH